MRITNIQAVNLELTDAIREYATEKVESLARFAKRFDPCDVEIQVGKSTDHHNKGDIYFADFLVSVPNEVIRVHNEMEDLYAAIDESKDDLKREFVERKELLVDRRESREQDDVLDDGSEGGFVEDDDEDEPFFGDDSLE